MPFLIFIVPAVRECYDACLTLFLLLLPQSRCSMYILLQVVFTTPLWIVSILVVEVENVLKHLLCLDSRRVRV